MQFYRFYVFRVHKRLLMLTLLLFLSPKYLQVVALAQMLRIRLSVNPPAAALGCFSPVAAPLPLSESSSNAFKHSFELADVVRALQLRWSLISASR